MLCPGSSFCPMMKCWRFFRRPRTHCECSPIWRNALRAFPNWTSYPIWISRQGSHTYCHFYMTPWLMNFYKMCTVFAQAIYSSEGECVQLIQHISTSEAKGAVEKWLVQVEDVMLRSVRDVVARSRVVRSLFHIPYIIHNTLILTLVLSCCVWLICCICPIWSLS